ncbi:MAG: DUF1524 domain-containing protein [Micrococcales bacterium]|nr:DUF1524 domain-containing protein [Micrococcales bacterium]
MSSPQPTATSALTSPRPAVPAPTPTTASSPDTPSQDNTVADALSNDLDPAYTPEVALTFVATASVGAPPNVTYNRDAFGGWAKANQHGWVVDKSCNTRQATLLRDGQNVTIEGRCKPVSGTWIDPYAGATITDPSKIDIDHIVPLAEAWRSGAWLWEPTELAGFANDPLEVVISDASQNRAKGDKGPAEWQPQPEVWCTYSLRWVAIKEKYALQLTSENERSALTKMLNTCQ